MSAILKRKIEAGSGVPSNILHMHKFWEQLEGMIKTWVFKTFSVETIATVESRQVISGKAADKILDSQFSYAFLPELSPGLRAIALDDVAAIQNASLRLNQDTDNFDNASPLFMKLISEEPATALWHVINRELIGEPLHDDPASPVSIISANGKFSEGSRYLKVGVEYDLNGQTSGVLMVFEFEFIERYMQEQLRGNDAPGDQSSQKDRKALRESVQASMITLDAVLERLSMTIGDCSRLTVGQILPLRGVDLGHLSLCAETINGRVDIGHGEIGVWKQQRAVKLSTNIIENFTQDLVI